MTPTDTETLLRQIIGGDSAASALIVDRARNSNEALLLAAAALIDPATPGLLARAAVSAATTRERQVVAITAAHLTGDRNRVDALARDHLVDYPDSILVSWIAAGAASNSSPTLKRVKRPYQEKEQS
jgi:hypothetical protein